MKLEDIQEMIDKAQVETKILIIKKEFYEDYKKEIDNLMKDNYLIDLCITNTLDEKTNAIIMDKKIFYGLDY